MSAPLPRPGLIPENAPFSAEQRAWLDGFFAGLLSFEGESADGGVSDAEALPSPEPFEDGDDGFAPWRDQCLPLEERLKLAEGRPLRRRLMAAMAQQDCGQCGYNCEDYANALFLRSETRLNLCAPGGKPTGRALNRLMEELSARTPSLAAPAATPSDPATSVRAGFSRDLPTEALFLSRRRLNKPGSEKETWFVEFDISASGIDYEVGDSYGLFPSNDPSLVESVIAAIGAAPDHLVGGLPLREALKTLSLGVAPDRLFLLISCLVGGERRRKAKALAAGLDADADAQALDVLGALLEFGVRPDPEAFVEALEPLQPRLYSISSSPKADPGRVALTVEAVRYSIGGRARLGVASTFLAERAAPGEKIRAYVQKTPHFKLPKDAATPIVMIGPGTGIAPFRAFLRERRAIWDAGGALGPNWLIFGHQREACDFFYEDELAAMQADGLLTRLSLAWSRDGAEKTYVQHRVLENGADIWNWLGEGAHLYVCGDAKRMAKDVEAALLEIVTNFGARSPEEAKAFVAGLRKDGRLQTDVY